MHFGCTESPSESLARTIKNENKNYINKYFSIHLNQWSTLADLNILYMLI